ncbi:MAG: membrane protein insertion efficiency factor YidD [Candidatus Kapaibacterium sp.]
MRKLLTFLIRLYQQIVSPHLGRNCRFEPTCSEYMSQAILKYGIFKGGYMGIKRIGRCHPLHPGGYDPLP